MERTTLLVENIKCGGCAKSIENALQKLDGVNEVSVAVESNEVSVSYASEESLKSASEKLASLGYPAKGTGQLSHSVKSFVSCAIGRLS